MTGTETSYEIANGGNGHIVQIILSVQNSPPGMHGVHSHSTGSCEGPDFKSTGGHFDPDPAGTTDPDVNHPWHIGDLPNLTVNAQRPSDRLRRDRKVAGTKGQGEGGGTPLACGVIVK